MNWDVSTRNEEDPDIATMKRSTKSSFPDHSDRRGDEPLSAWRRRHTGFRQRSGGITAREKGEGKGQDKGQKRQARANAPHPGAG